MEGEKNIHPLDDGPFSGDGSGLSARLFSKYGATIIGAVHLKMPDSVADVKALKRPFEENRRIVIDATIKLEKAVEKLKAGSLPREGLGLIPRLCGFFGQRLYFGHKTKKYSNKLKIDPNKCIGCEKCASICPMKTSSSETNRLIQTINAPCAIGASAIVQAKPSPCLEKT